MRITGKTLLLIDRMFWVPYRLATIFPGLLGKISSETGAHENHILVIKLMGLGSLIKFASLCEKSEVDKRKITLITFERHREFCRLFGFECALFIRTVHFTKFIHDCW